MKLREADKARNILRGHVLSVDIPRLSAFGEMITEDHEDYYLVVDCNDTDTPVIVSTLLEARDLKRWQLARKDACCSDWLYEMRQDGAVSICVSGYTIAHDTPPARYCPWCGDTRNVDEAI